jgi:hypothetical protein
MITFNTHSSTGQLLLYWLHRWRAWILSPPGSSFLEKTNILGYFSFFLMVVGVTLHDLWSMTTDQWWFPSSQPRLSLSFVSPMEGSSYQTPQTRVQEWDPVHNIQVDRSHDTFLQSNAKCFPGAFHLPGTLSTMAFLFFFFYYSYVHTMLGSFLPPAPTPSLTTHSAPSLSPPPPQYPAETILSLFLILL